MGAFTPSKSSSFLIALAAFSFLQGHLALAETPQTPLTKCEIPLTMDDRIRRDVQISAFIQDVETHYGPILLKKDTVGLDWAALKARFQAEAGASASVHDFYMASARFLESLKDAHVSVQLPSTYVEALPVQFIYVEGQTLILSVASTFKASKEGVQLNPGDEVVTVDGQTPMALRAQLAAYGSVGNDSTDPVLLSFMLTRIREGRGFQVDYVAARQSVLSIRKPGSQSLTTVTLDWMIGGTPIIDRRFLDAGPAPAPSFPTLADATKRTVPGEADVVKRSLPDRRRASLAAMTVEARINRLMTMSHTLAKTQVNLVGHQNGTDSNYSIGSPKPFFVLPADFKPLQANAAQNTLTKALEASTGLTAGTFQRNGKTVGFLRIPSYEPEDIDLAIFGLRSIMAKLQAQSDYLIIDQTNNPGGYVMFSDWVIWSLTGKNDDSKHMHFAVRPTQEFLREYVEIVESIESDPSFTDEFKGRYLPRFKAEFDKVKTAYETNAVLSEPISLSLMSEFFEETNSTNMMDLLKAKFTPAMAKQATAAGGVDLSQRQVYTKPVFMIINELDFSAGDATPANLQDYGRVKLVGVRTAGAGGAVGSYSNTVFNEFTYHLTNSLMIRSNPQRRYVENGGILPDYPMPLKASDVVDGFSNYFERLMQIVDGIAK